MNAVFLDDRLRDFLYFCIGGEAEIILRGEVEAAETRAAVILGRADSERSFLGRFRIRPQSVAASQILPAIKCLHATDKVRATQLAKVTHAASKCLHRVDIGIDC